MKLTFLLSVTHTVHAVGDSKLILGMSSCQLSNGSTLDNSLLEALSKGKTPDHFIRSTLKAMPINAQTTYIRDGKADLAHEITSTKLHFLKLNIIIS